MATTAASAPESSVMETLFSYDNTAMLAAIICLLVVILFVLLLHLYARWFLSHHNHPDHHSRRRRQTSSVTTYDLSPPHPTKHPQTSGLSSATISSIPTFSYPEQSTAVVDCAVCLSEFEEGEKVRRLPRCKHCFHVECIDTWLREQTTCPVCRLDVVAAQCCKENDVVLDVGGVEEGESVPERAVFERLVRMAISRSCRSNVVEHRLDRPRPSV